VSQVVGFIREKSAIHLARVYGGKKALLCRSALLGQGLLCIPVGRDQERREYIKKQEAEDTHTQPGDLPGYQHSLNEEGVEVFNRAPTADAPRPCLTLFGRSQCRLGGAHLPPEAMTGRKELVGPAGACRCARRIFMSPTFFGVLVVSITANR
jgi:putative transposase